MWHIVAWCGVVRSGEVWRGSLLTQQGRCCTDMMGAEDSFEGRFDWLGVVNREDLLTSYLLHMSDGRASNQNVERVVKAIRCLQCFQWVFIVTINQ